jgi:hypothetical protein
MNCLITIPINHELWDLDVSMILCYDLVEPCEPCIRMLRLVVIPHPVAKPIFQCREFQMPCCNTFLHLSQAVV